MHISDVKDIQLKMTDGNVLNFKFSVGTARKIKEWLGKDVMTEDLTDDWFSTASIIFAASYFMACKSFKTPPVYTREQLDDYFEELDTNTAIEFIKAFNGALSVKATPETLEVVKEAEKVETIDAGSKVSEEEAPNK